VVRKSNRYFNGYRTVTARLFCLFRLGSWGSVGVADGRRGKAERGSGGPGQNFESPVQGGQSVMKSFSLVRIAVFLVLLLAGCVSDGGLGSAPRKYTDPGTMWAP
jgi:hypothetical protein